MIENGKQLLLLILSVILIALIAMKCDTNKNILPKESITKIEYKRDTDQFNFRCRFLALHMKEYKKKLTVTK